MKEIPQELGYTYNKPEIDLNTLLTPDIERVCFRAKKVFEEIIFDTVKLEGNPFTFPEVKTLLEGVTIGGHKLSDQNQVLNQAESWRCLLRKVEQKKFIADKATFCKLHALAAKDEALKWGSFRDGSVSIAGTEHKPPTAEKLDMIFNKGVEYILNIENPIECGMTFFLFGALNQFFYDVNKRTSRLIMNGILLSSGFDVINIPAKKQLEFNKKMVDFYNTQDGTEMMQFLMSCSLDEKLAQKF